MTRTIQILRGTEAQNDAFTGAVGELTMDTTNNEIRIHDGSTVGGHKIGGTIQNQNTAPGATNPIYDWVGTLAEYTAQDIENTHPDWLCFITDDVDGGASVYTKTETDGKFVTKGHQVIEFQAPTAENNYTWYRKYADGWVEQGGYITGNTSAWSSKTITLPVTMANRYYYISRNGNWSDASSSSCTITSQSPTSFTLNYALNTMDFGGTMWEVKGMAA